jgi:hypothetical protein
VNGVEILDFKWVPLENVAGLDIRNPKLMKVVLDGLKSGITYPLALLKGGCLGKETK